MEDLPVKTFPLSPFDNFLPQVTWYAQKMLFFKASGYSREEITQHGRKAFDRTLELIPALGGSVVPLEHEAQRGRWAIGAPFRTAEELVTVKFFDKTDYADLKKEHFPINVLRKMDVFPENLWLHHHALRLQLNFLNGGLILAVRGAHCVMDGHGILIILNAVAAFLRGDDGSKYCGPSSISAGPLMSGIPARLDDFRSYERRPPTSASWISKVFSRIGSTLVRRLSDFLTYKSILLRRRPVDEGAQQEKIFFFSESKIRNLKDIIMANRDQFPKKNGEIPWMSSHDILVALVWCCITKTWDSPQYRDTDTNPMPLKRIMRQLFQRTTEPLSFLAFFIDGRRYLKDPPLGPYIGNAILLSAIWGKFSSVKSDLESVTRYSIDLRRRILDLNQSYVLRTAGALASVPDIRDWRLATSPFPQSCIMINSSANNKLYEVDFGPVFGNCCERVRSPGFSGCPMGFVLPKLEGSPGIRDQELGYEVVIKLKKKYMDALNQDEFFKKYAEWRCD